MEIKKSAYEYLIIDRKTLKLWHKNNRHKNT